MDRTREEIVAQLVGREDLRSRSCSDDVVSEANGYEAVRTLSLASATRGRMREVVLNESGIVFDSVVIFHHKNRPYFIPMTPRMIKVENMLKGEYATRT